MAKLALMDVFREPRVTKTLVAVDLTDSTAMKEQQPEVQWLNTYAWFFELLSGTICDAIGGKIVKYLGDGAMAVFDEDHPADAINWAIAVQESIVDAQDARSVFCDCSIGITYGKVVEFDTEDGKRDYVGSVVDKAFRLCGVANAKAIFVDTDTIIAAPMHRVQSRVGMNSMPRRTATEYQGPVNEVKVKGFSKPIKYHEILWASSPYAIRKEYVSSISSEPLPPPPPPPQVRAAAGWAMKGRVINLSARFGFIRSADGEDFWFNADYLFRRTLPAKNGDEVWFNPLPPFPEKKNRRAADVLPLGTQLDGRIEKLITQKGYGFAGCTSDRGEAKQVFLFLGQEGAGAWSVGMHVEFTVSQNAQGIAGVQPRVKGFQAGA